MFDYKKLLSVVSVNTLNLFVSTILILILPKFMLIRDYSFWQLYLFYVGYIGIFHLGWLDGLYLSLGGKDYREIVKFKLAKKSILFILSQIIFAFFFYILIVQVYKVEDDGKLMVILFVTFSIVILNLRQFFITLLQASNRIYEYSIIILTDRLLFLSGLTFLFLKGGGVYLSTLLIIETGSKLFSLLLAFIFNSKLYTLSSLESEESTKSFFKDVWDTIKAGSLLLMANYASIFIIGIFRWGIEWKWGVEVFGKISLVLSVSNLILAFLSAISVVLYPILRRFDREKLPELYSHYRSLLSLLLLAFILCYFPLYGIIYYWLPEYKDIFSYFIFIFPICIFEGKISLLFYTFLKAIRKEKTIFYSNVLTLFCSVLLSLLFIVFLESLEWTIYSILFVMFLKCFVLERALNKELNKFSAEFMLYELIGIVFFIYVTLYFSNLEAFFIYLSLYFMVLISSRKRLLESIAYLRNSKA